MNKTKKKLVNYLVKAYSFTNDEVEILIDYTVPLNVNRSVLFNGETSHEIVADIQVNTEDDVTTRNTVILNGTANSISTRINTAADKYEIDDLSIVIEVTFSYLNYLSETIEK